MARDYKAEYENYQGRPDQIKKRSLRNKARRALEKAGLVSKGDGKDVDHVKPIAKGGGTSRSNLRVRSDNANRSFRRTKNAGMK
jgi:5-methylcytosine-specific restriction endonuclease McrA